ncbi:MAG: hypothetical protein AAGK71_13800 [Pseudomonadota bacterium]
MRDISPCPGATKPDTPQPANIDAPHQRVRSRGFVDRDVLARALVKDRAKTSVQSVMTVERVSSKVLRAVEVLGQRSS